MPPRPPWHARAATIRKDLERLRVPVLDRAMIEQVFHIERRTAQRLLRTLDGHLSAQTSIVPREAVIAMLDQLLAGKAIAAETGRKERLADALQALERQSVPKATAIATIPVPDGEAAWPEGTGVAEQGVFAIRFSHPEELLGRILAVTELAAGDYARFVARLEVAGEPRG